MPRVALYARISEDPKDVRAGVDRQRDDCIALAARRGWDITEHYIDNDLSAYRKAVVRPRFEQMLTDLTGGDLDGIVVYDLDRLVRQPRDLERLIDIYEGSDHVFASAEGDIDLQGSGGRTMARVLTAFANKSSSDTGRRVSRAHLEAARKGLPPGGPRTFGWRDKIELDPVEAAHARGAIDQVMNGVPLAAVMRDLNERGIKTSKGGEWTDSGFRFYLRNPRLAGFRAHKGEIMLDDLGEPVMGLHEPLIGREEWEVLQLRVAKAKGGGKRPGGRTHMLSGLLRCGVCGGPMFGDGSRPNGGHVYSCRKGHNKILGVETDDFIGDLAFDALQDIQMDTEPVQWDGEARLNEIAEKIAELMGLYAQGKMSAAVVLPVVQQLEEEQQGMQKDRAQWLDATGSVSKQVSREEWDSYDLIGRRLIIDSLLTAVLVKKAERRGTLSLERLEPVWRTQPR